MTRFPYSDGRRDAATVLANCDWIPNVGSYVANIFMAASMESLVGRFTQPVRIRRYWAGFRDQMAESGPDLISQSPLGQSSQPTTCNVVITNTTNKTMLETAIQNLADAINNAAAALAGGKLPTNVVSIAAGAGKTTPAATPAATTSKPAAGNTDALAKARAAKAASDKAKKDAEAAAAAEAAAGDDLSLLDGAGGEGEEVTLETLRDLGMQVLKAKKQPAMKAALGELGAESISALDPANYAAAKEALEAILL